MTYPWLNDQAPKMIREAMKLLGVREVSGPGNSETILGWAAEIGLPTYKHDETPWCGLFIALVAKRAGKPVVDFPLWAKNWLKWGEAALEPSLGDILVFSRPGGGGHVGLYVGENKDCYMVLGGNQGDRVSIISIAKKDEAGRDRLLGARRYYAVAAPASVRPYWIDGAEKETTLS